MWSLGWATGRQAVTLGLGGYGPQCQGTGCLWSRWLSASGPSSQLRVSQGVCPLELALRILRDSFPCESALRVLRAPGHTELGRGAA